MKNRLNEGRMTVCAAVLSLAGAICMRLGVCLCR